MKKLGKRSSLESGTFFAYACNCNCGSVPCGTCNNCNNYKNPQSTGAYALSYVTEVQLNNKSFGPMTLLVCCLEIYLHYFLIWKVNMI